MTSKSLMIVALSALAFATSCKDASQTPQKEGVEKAAAPVTGNKEIAFVEIDSLLTQYTFCIEQKAELESKSKQFEAQMAGKMSQIEKAYMEFQQKMQNGGFTSQEQAQAAQQRIQKLQQDGAQLEQRLTKQMASEQEHFNNTLRDSLKSFLKDYNKQKRYSIIVAKQGDNLLYADEKLNLTKEVIEGMNKRYKAAQKKK